MHDLAQETGSCTAGSDSASRKQIMREWLTREFYVLYISFSSFSQTHKVGNVGIIANFVFPYIFSFLLYLHQLMLVNVRLEIKGHMRITF